MVEKNRLINFPISFFSIMLGLLGFTIANQKAVEILHLPYKISSIMIWLSVGIFSLLLIVLITKLIKYTSVVIEDYNHPIKMNFFPTIGISLIMFSIVFIEINFALARNLWIIGTIIQTIFTFSLISKWMHQDVFKITHFNPSWFIPAVGNILIPVSGISFYSKEISWFYFSVGFILWIVLLTIFFYRAFSHSKIAEKMLPTLFLLMAPQAVGFIAYVKLTGVVDPFAKILYYFTLFTAMLLLTQFRYFSKIKYYLSWWAYSFPISAFSIATMLMLHKTNLSFFKYVAYFGFGILNVLIVILIFQTIKYMIKKEICIEE
jgi:tellurite resistance protein